ncbi:uncharacterized protein LOC110974727 isoform X2 [Acanthaster planci]|nr:uncharacterized protein LOC110974727 isoform X2 [Acanthaster planci]
MVIACLISIAITVSTIGLCVILNLCLCWGIVAKGSKLEDQRSSKVKAFMRRNKIWGFLRASGEEVGWRCFLLPCLLDTYSPASALFISGVIWGLFHVAVMVLLTHKLKVKHPLMTVTVQCTSVLLNAYSHGWITMRSGYSLWPSAIMHCTWNIVNPLVLGSIYTHEPGLIVGEQWLINGEGLAGCIVSIPLVLLIVNDMAG